MLEHIVSPWSKSLLTRDPEEEAQLVWVQCQFDGITGMTDYTIQSGPRLVSLVSPSLLFVFYCLVCLRIPAAWKTLLAVFTFRRGTEAKVESEFGCVAVRLHNPHVAVVCVVVVISLSFALMSVKFFCGFCFIIFA